MPLASTLNHIQNKKNLVDQRPFLLHLFIVMSGEIQVQWNLYKAGTIRSEKKCPLYEDVRFIECFPKTHLFSKI